MTELQTKLADYFRAHPEAWLPGMAARATNGNVWRHRHYGSATQPVGWVLDQYGANVDTLVVKWDTNSDETSARCNGPLLTDAATVGCLLDALPNHDVAIQQRGFGWPKWACYDHTLTIGDAVLSEGKTRAEAIGWAFLVAKAALLAAPKPKCSHCEDKGGCSNCNVCGLCHACKQYNDHADTCQYSGPFEALLMHMEPDDWQDAGTKEVTGPGWYWRTGVQWHGPHETKEQAQAARKKGRPV